VRVERDVLSATDYFFVEVVSDLPKLARAPGPSLKIPRQQ
jgi:hypothetical protein